MNRRQLDNAAAVASLFLYVFLVVWLVLTNGGA